MEDRGLRRESKERPFTDVIHCSPTRSTEREIANHPSLKPQNYMRQIVRASLPLGEGIVLDPFMGGGSTIAAAEFNRYASIGLELDPTYFDLAATAVPRLARYSPGRSSDDTADKEERDSGGTQPSQRRLFD
ncbi:MAG: site-specific DNA-methyltransferase [Sandaracinaceae bacterium]|nr:site-specific DNA-methyltransferase [Sandaracinaceae bacterium]